MPFPEFADWKAPWDDKQDPFDAERARKYVYDMQREREGVRDELKDAKTSVATLTTERDALATKVTTLEADGSDVTQLKSQLADLTSQLEQQQAATKQGWLDAVKEEFGLTDKQVKKLDGDDLEALRNDARETFGDPAPEEQPPGDEDEEAPPADGDENPPPAPKRTVPATAPRRVRNLGDPDGDAPKRPTAEEVLAKIPL